MPNITAKGIKSNMIKALLQQDMLEGKITINSEDTFDIRFSLTPPLLNFAQGIVFEDRLRNIQIAVATEKGQHEIPWDGHSVTSSITSSALFKQQVLKKNTATRFCHSNASVLKQLNRCACDTQTLTEQRLIGFDLSYPEIPRKRGVLVAGKCSEGCGYWRIQAFDVDTRHIHDYETLIEFVQYVCHSQGLHLPPLQSIVDEPSQVHTFYAVGSSKRQREATKNKVTALKGITSLDELKRHY